MPIGGSLVTAEYTPNGTANRDPNQGPLFYTFARFAALPLADRQAYIGRNVIDPVLLTVVSVNGEGDLNTTGLVIASEVPSTVLTGGNTGIGTTATAIAVITIPGGLMRLKTKLLLEASIEMSGADAKTLGFRAGTIAGGFAGATFFGGQAGLTTQVEATLSAFIWNQGTLSSQRATALNQAAAYHAGQANAPVTAAIDTSVDWNIWINVAANAATAADVFTLRNYSLKVNSA